MEVSTTSHARLSLGHRGCASHPWGLALKRVLVGILLIAMTVGTTPAAAQNDYAAYIYPRSETSNPKPLFAAIVQRYPSIDISLDPSMTLLQLTNDVVVVEQDIADAANEGDFALFFFANGTWGMVLENADPELSSFPLPTGSEEWDLDPAALMEAKDLWIAAHPEAYERLKRSGAAVLGPRK